MADTRISKIKVRQGDFSDLPVLDPGEIGYAKDQRRLFIGNDIVNIGTGNGVLTQFTVPITLSKPNIITVFAAVLVNPFRATQAGRSASVLVLYYLFSVLKQI